MFNLSQDTVATENWSVELLPPLSHENYEYLMRTINTENCGDLVDFTIADHNDGYIEYFYEFQNISINIDTKGKNYFYKQG